MFSPAARFSPSTSRTAWLVDQPHELSCASFALHDRHQPSSSSCRTWPASSTSRRGSRLALGAFPDSFHQRENQRIDHGFSLLCCARTVAPSQPGVAGGLLMVFPLYATPSSVPIPASMIVPKLGRPPNMALPPQ